MLSKLDQRVRTVRAINFRLWSYAMEYEERVTEILSTLKGAQIMDDEKTPIPSTFWKQKYQQDIPFLLKELANTRDRTRDLNKQLQSMTESKDRNALWLQEANQECISTREAITNLKQIIDNARKILDTK